MRRYWTLVFSMVFAIYFVVPISAQKVGLQLYSLRNQFKKDVEGTLKLVSDWGITYLEGGDSYGMEQDDFIALLGKYNLEMVGIGASYEDLARDPEAVVQKAKDYGAAYVMCPWIPHKGNTFTINDVKKAVALFNKSGKILKDHGITLVYHPHGYEFRPYAEGTLFDYMAENAEYFKFELDIYWAAHGGEDPVELMKSYPDKFVLMHLKDMKKGTVGNNTGLEDVDTNVVLGTGSLNMPAIVKKAGELGIDYMFIEDESSRVVSQIPKSLAYLKSL